MPIHVDTMQQALRTIDLPPGPALLYVSEGDAPTVTILDRAPGGRPPQDRDRAICRALLEYVLDQMDADEPPRARDALIALGWTPPAQPVAGEPVEIADLPVAVRQLVHAVDRMRDQWAEGDDDHRYNLWSNVHAANEAVWNRHVKGQP